MVAEFTKGDLNKMYEALGATKEQLDDDVQTVINWIKTQPHLPEVMSETHVLNFLLLNKRSIEKTKQKIDAYYTIRSKVPDWFSNINPNGKTMKDYFKDCVAGLHPKPMEGLYRIYYYKPLAPKAFQPRPWIVQFFNTLELRLHYDYTFGDIAVYDFEHLSMEDFGRITPAFAANAVKIYEKIFSFRMKTCYIINSSPAVEILMGLLKNLMKPKLYERIVVSKNADILKKSLPAEFIPKDYGGEAPSLIDLNNSLNAMFVAHNDRFEALDKMRVNEDLRPEKLSNDEYLGFHGNFKKLNFD